VTTPTHRRPGARRLRAGALAVLAVALVAGCAADPLPEPAPQASDVPVPVVTDAQLDTSLETIGTVLAAGDAATDPKVAAAALAGPALTQRTGAYAVKQRDANLDFAVPLGTERLQDVVPVDQEWPRTVVTVTRQSAEDKAPDLLVLTQTGPRDPYRLVAYTEMAGGATLPLTGGTDQGVRALPPDAEGLLATPEATIAAYADVLTQGAASKNAPLFAQSSFTDDVLAVQTSTAKALSVDCARCFRFGATHTPQAGQLWSYETEDGGALVVGAMDAAMSIRANKGYKMNLQAEFKAVSGKSQITQSGVFTHIEVVALYIPPEGGEETVQVLAVDRVPTSGTVS
jgi:hypothetical protein